MPPSIPDRWIPYKACGKLIDGTRLICFKVPLRKGVQVDNPDITEIWDIPALLEAVPNLGAVIDLTNTNRYYNPRELQAAGVLHKKILMPGRVIPPENKVQEFMDTVDEFLGKNCDFVVGVHCTHGLNRTGYMVCRYMRDRLNIPAKTAIKQFEIARGYQIERDNYIADLLGKSPPGPDLGKNTVIKPHEDRRNSMTYRSPLEDYDDGGQSSSRYNSSRYHRSNYRERDRNERRDSESSYDYRYDY